MRIIGTASLMRHGISAYTHTFPDITPEGIPGIKKTARGLAIRYSNKIPIFFSSPSPRAIATTLHLLPAFDLDDDRNRIIIENDLRAVDIYNSKKFFSLIKETTGHLNNALEIMQIWDKYFLEDAVFEAGIICESKTLAKIRFMNFLKKLGAVISLVSHPIIVSHLDTIGSLLKDWFRQKDNFLQPAEAFQVVFFDNETIKVEFRDQKTTICI
jgi:broad specificity phosphatase PhoE